MSKSVKASKNLNKRAYHRQDVHELNRTALMIGGGAAGIILLLMFISFV